MNNLYLCKPNQVKIGALNGLKIETCNLNRNLDIWELTFEVSKYVSENGKLVVSNYYDLLSEDMEIYLQTDDLQEYFIIDSMPQVHGENDLETTTVTAHTSECELQKKNLKNFKVNRGTSDSLEYLNADKETGFDDKGLPKFYITLVNHEHPEFSLLHLALEKAPGWSVAEGLDPVLCEKKYSFDIDEMDIYSFLVTNVAAAAKIHFDFDRKNKKIGFTSLESLGDDTGVVITKRNLLNQFDVTSSEDCIFTKYTPTGGDDLNITFVNFGSNYIWNMDYYVNATDKEGNLKYVDEEFRDKYNAWMDYRNGDETYEPDGITLPRRKLYAYFTKKYNQTELDINELVNKLPNDGCNIDYTKFSYEELKFSLTAYKKLVATIYTAYKEQYKVTVIGLYPDYEIISVEEGVDSTSIPNIKDTVYYSDLYAFEQIIIPKIYEAMKAYCKTDSSGNLIFEKGEPVEEPGGNKQYYVNPSIVKVVDHYLYEWDLYGLAELEIKKKAWLECAYVLYKDEFILSGSEATNDVVYRTADMAGWNSLSDEQKQNFSGSKEFIDALNLYLDYMSNTVRENSLMKEQCIGIIRQCDEAIAIATEQKDDLEKQKKRYEAARKDLAARVCDIDHTMLKFKLSDSSPTLFNERDYKLLNRFIKESNYSNDNIFITSLDDTVSMVDKEEELYQDAFEALSIVSQPQYSFSTSMDNLFNIEEFEPMWDEFQIGNFIRVKLDENENKYIKLRIIKIENNPLVDNQGDLTVEFSTMKKSFSEVSDLGFLLGESASGGSSGGGSSSSGSGGTYGKNDAEIQISNNLLNALLKSETFGTNVTDVILDSITANKGNFNVILSRSGIFDRIETGEIKIRGYATSNDLGNAITRIDNDIQDVSNTTANEFKTLKESLESGETVIHGGCISTGNILSSNWNGTNENPLGNTAGSILMLENGAFNFGGNSIKFDSSNNTLNIGQGSLTYDPINGLKISGGSKLTTSTGTGTVHYGSIDGLQEALYDAQTKTNGLANGTTTINGGCITTGIIKSSNNVSQINLNNGTFSFGNGALTWDPTNGLIVNGSGTFSGNLSGAGGTFSGTLTAAVGGVIGGWNITSDCLYKGSNIFGATGGIYLGDNGISLGDYFKVNSDGIMFNTKGYSSSTYKTYFGKDNDYIAGGNTALRLGVDESGDIFCIGDIDNYSITMYAYVKWSNGDGNAFHYTRAKNSGHTCTKISQNYAKLRYSYSNISNVALNIYTDRVDKGIEWVGILYIQSTLQIEKVYLNRNSSLQNIYVNTLSEFKSDNIGISCDFKQGIMKGRMWELNGDCLIFNGVNYHDVEISNNVLLHRKSYDNSVSGRSLYISSDGTIGTSSSSKRYKNSISESLEHVSDPHGLYDIGIFEYKYNDDYFTSRKDEGIGKYNIGFIVENMYDHFKDGVILNKDGLPESWDIRYIFPAALKLIQEQHEDIEKMKERIEELEQKVS